MSESQPTVIVGGGIWGLSTAYHLAKMGCTNIRVLERNSDTAVETTSRAAGLVGQIRSTPLMCRAIQYALDLLTRFGDETGHDPGLRRTGSLLVALTSKRMEAYERQVQQAKERGIDAEFVSQAQMQRLVPDMDVSKLQGGYFVAGDGYLDPRKCAQSYSAAAMDLGVSIELNTEVTGLQIQDGRMSCVETSGGKIAAEQVIVTAGPWTGLISKRAGFQMAMQPIRHQRVLTMPTDGIPDHHPVVRVTDISCYVRPEQGGYLYGFFEPNPTAVDLEGQPADFRTDDIQNPVDTMREAQRRLAPIFPIIGELQVAEYRQGMTTFAPDGQYLIGPVPDVDGLFVASGCAALGIAGSAAVGRWLANWVLHGRPEEDLEEFQLERFGKDADNRHWLQREAEHFYATYYAIQ